MANAALGIQRDNDVIRLSGRLGIMRATLPFFCCVTMMLAAPLSGQTRSAVAQADSARFWLCNTVAAGVSALEAGDQLVADGNATRSAATEATAMLMRPLPDALLSNVEMHMARAELSEVDAPSQVSVDSLLALLADGLERVDAFATSVLLTDSQPTWRELERIEVVALHITTRMEREYARVRVQLIDAADLNAPQLPGCTGHETIHELEWP